MTQSKCEPRRILLGSDSLVRGDKKIYEPTQINSLGEYSDSTALNPSKYLENLEIEGDISPEEARKLRILDRKEEIYTKNKQKN